MQLIDTHCHIDFPQFESSRTEVLTRAAEAGIRHIIVPGVNAAGWGGIEALFLAHCKNRPRLHMALGLHPCFLHGHQSQDLEQLEQLLSSKPVCAVGEIGLDLFIPQADLDEQLRFLKPQLALAEKYQLPVLLHVRKAHDQMLKQLRLFKLTRGGIVHAFSGSEQQAHQYIELGFKLGLGGTVTYERAQKLRRTVQAIAVEHFVLETDAPDMPLSGYQGKPNEPCRVLDVAKVVADLKDCTLEEVAAITSQQALQLFNIDQSSVVD
ncbi:TatD family hydrolase [Neptuniibacter sp. 1_MG-2023]|uniref:TatD family hydrolase n=1 Tax=Neptuniibacter sp. 1_MG-2023 TaxID=3062662 RepID=UPI0026E11E96|nr:TatD family hydrolase [Neptuniibacter sp. 1_MG-2023]MDO6593385.1 TatD family hydrolase [Neptuniibacter sp. 1_MG-2023]